ncbi:MAG: Gfo/Idh/MocA family oxidoreductase [Lentisphaeria bacterium]|nr:Gfo/Idh/MocA family oxidoreductase [Lentisphaeria bacterium]
MKRKIRMGMVGGGPGAFIGDVHRMAARLDGMIELVCGAFSSHPDKNRAAGNSLFLPESRCYDTFEEMFEKEKSLPEGERMDFVSITTPNHLHAPIALKALQNGFHVVCEKPMTLTVEEAEALAAEVERSGLLFCLTHNYTAYPMIRTAGQMIRAGELGSIRRIMVEYPQGWLADAVTPDNIQGSWRTNPVTSGVSCCMGDIGSHSENLAEFITGLKISELCANIKSFVPGRLLDDDGDVLLKFDNGAIGSLSASQIAVGEENALKIRVYGTKAAIEWNQQTPESLVIKYNDRPMQIMRRNWAGAGGRWSRLPAGHPEGFIEAFGNLYRDMALAIDARMQGVEYKTEFPTVHDGLRGVRFIHAVVASKGQWIKL